MQSTTILKSTTPPSIDDIARPVAHQLMPADFARGQRQSSREFVTTGDFATGQRRSEASAMVGTFATGMRSTPPSTVIGDFATGMRSVHASQVTAPERTDADAAMPLAA